MTLPAATRAPGVPVGSGTWRNLAQLGMDLYPQMFLAPNGKVFNRDRRGRPVILIRPGAVRGAFSRIGLFPGRTDPTYRDYGSGVMYAPGKSFVMGWGPADEYCRGDRPQSDLTDLARCRVDGICPASAQCSAVARRHCAVTGGTSSPGFNNPAGAVHAAELWNPTTEQWTTLASSSGIPRVYHSTALLLPDARVLSMGGNGFRETEIYSPPYLFKERGPRSRQRRPASPTDSPSSSERQTPQQFQRSRC